MTRNNSDVLVPAKNKLEKNLRELGTFHDKDFADNVLKNDDIMQNRMLTSHSLYYCQRYHRSIVQAKKKL